MSQASLLGKLAVNGLFKDNKDFELHVRRSSQIKGKSIVQLFNGRGKIHLVCGLQMREIRRVRVVNKEQRLSERLKPAIKCKASFKAIIKQSDGPPKLAKTGIEKLDVDFEKPVVLTTKGGYSECVEYVEHSCDSECAAIPRSRKIALPTKMLLPEIESCLRLDSRLSSKKVGAAAEKLIGLQKGTLSYTQSYRLRKSALEVINGPLE